MKHMLFKIAYEFSKIVQTRYPIISDELYGYATCAGIPGAGAWNYVFMLQVRVTYISGAVMAAILNYLGVLKKI